MGRVHAAAALPALAALLAGCTGETSAPPRALPDAPDVLLITVDTLRADRLGFLGYARPTSPALDAFAERAVVFERAEASAPWTLPALASVLTGELTSTHGCWHFASALGESFTTLAERLLAAGYDTACVATQRFVTSRQGLEQGFVHFDDSHAYTELRPEASINSQSVSDRALRFIEQKAASPTPAPWFLWLHYLDPHAAYVPHPGISEAFVTPGERTKERIDEDLYDGEIRYTDLHIGRVLEALERNGLAGRTVVVFLSDHGEELLDHGGRGHGHTLYQELVHVPLVIRAPGVPAARVGALARQVDVLPTILELCGLAAPPGIAGRSLVPLLRGGTLEEVPSLTELGLAGTDTVDGLRRGRHKLVRTAQGREWSALFDLDSDPRETRDVQAEHPELVQELAAELERLRAAARERGRLFGPPREVVFTPGEEEDLKALGYGGEQR